MDAQLEYESAEAVAVIKSQVHRLTDNGLAEVLKLLGADKIMDALAPFARYAHQQEKAWTHHDDCVFYGVKRPGAHQITYGDWRRAAKAMGPGQ